MRLQLRFWRAICSILLTVVALIIPALAQQAAKKSTGQPPLLDRIVFPHGGPWARDSWGYDTFAQFLANRGYGVLQPNFRGSTG